MIRRIIEKTRADGSSANGDEPSGGDLVSVTNVFAAADRFRSVSGQDAEVLRDEHEGDRLSRASSDDATTTLPSTSKGAWLKDALVSRFFKRMFVFMVLLGSIELAGKRPSTPSTNQIERLTSTG